MFNLKGPGGGPAVAAVPLVSLRRDVGESKLTEPWGNAVAPQEFVARAQNIPVQYRIHLILHEMHDGMSCRVRSGRDRRVTRCTSTGRPANTGCDGDGKDETQQENEPGCALA